MAEEPVDIDAEILASEIKAIARNLNLKMEEAYQRGLDVEAYVTNNFLVGKSGPLPSISISVKREI